MLIPTVFILTYIGMAAGRIAFFRLERTGMALLALMVLLLGEAIAVKNLAQYADFPTLLLLFGLMIVSAQLEIAGFYGYVASFITSRNIAPKLLLAGIIAASGLLSAFLANDIVVFAMTPIIAQGLLRRGLNPVPFLIALTAAANAGSAATIIGNPQNILLAQTQGLEFWAFFKLCAVPAIFSLGVIYGVIVILWKEELNKSPLASDIRLLSFNAWQTFKGGLAVLALIVLFTLNLPREIAALVIAGMLLISRTNSSREVLAAVDWHLLLLFFCLFTVTGLFATTPYAREGVAFLVDKGFTPWHLGFLLGILLLASNLIGNVPAIMLLLAVFPVLDFKIASATALFSTLAGNLTIAGSLANIITAERAALVGVKLGFAEHAKAGVPITLISLAFSFLWFWGLG